MRHVPRDRLCCRGTCLTGLSRRISCAPHSANLRARSTALNPTESTTRSARSRSPGAQTLDASTPRHEAWRLDSSPSTAPSSSWRDQERRTIAVMGKSLWLGIAGCGAICFGSIVAGTFPGDGQTGMVAFPLWLLGGALGITALLMAAFRPEDRRSLPILLVLAALATGSVFWSYKASERYVEEWYRMHPEVKKPK